MAIITLAQINPVIGDFEGNADALIRRIKENPATDIFLASELALPGYMPYDYLEFGAGLEARQRAAVQKIAASLAAHQHALVGGIRRCEKTRALHNSAFIISSSAAAADGGVRWYDKQALPNDDVFFEKRYFARGAAAGLYTIGPLTAGIAVCFDLWEEEFSMLRQWQHAPRRPDVIFWLSASPYTTHKHAHRLALARDAAAALSAPLCMVNMAGANDEVVFDGQSFVMDARGEVLGSCALCADDALTVELAADEGAAAKKTVADNTAATPLPPLREYRTPVHFEIPSADKAAEILTVLQTGLVDYLAKTGSPRRVHVGLSGGIDSALTAAIAARALGSEAVTGILLPSRFTGRQSIDDALALANALGIQTRSISIEHIFARALDEFSSSVQQDAPAANARDAPRDVSEENMQARIRGLLLMAYSNKFGSMLLTTGNKSETATGYCTLYGDMCGSLNLIGDVYKTEVYALARALNELDARRPIPESTLTREPTAELRDNQKDSDSLPPYAVLDAVLYEFIEKKQLPEMLLGEPRFDAPTVQLVWNLLTKSEYKRRQAAPIIKISDTAFGRGRMMPIAARM